MLAVLLALGAALAYAAASVLQQREAEADDGTRGGGGVALVLRLARRPLWLGGLACDGLGYLLQAVALGVGELLVVQPVVTSGILFALPAAARWSRRKLTGRDFAWAVTLAIGLALFVVLAAGDTGKDRASATAWVVCALVAFPTLAVVLTVAARSLGTRRAVLFAFAAGAIFGITAALTKATAVLLNDHGIGALQFWEPYALLVLGGLGFVVNQRAFQAGSLTASLPTLTVTEPVVAVIIGITMLDESIAADSVPGWLAVTAGAVAMIAATIALSRSAARHDRVHEHELPAALARVERTR
jgi:drug/metabolite transporter (DMT)-like permease